MTEHLKVFKEPEIIKIGLEKTRSKILNILKEDDHTIKEIAEKLDKDRSTIYRHVKKLEDAGYIENKNTDDDENKYCRVAHTIFLDLEYMDYEVKMDIIFEWDLDFETQDLVRMDNIGYRNDKSKRLLKDIQSFISDLDKRLKDRVESLEKDIDKEDMMIIMRVRLLGYMILCSKNDICRKRLNNIFSKFDKKIDLNLADGD